MWGEFSRLGLGYTGPNPPDPLTEYPFPLKIVTQGCQNCLFSCLHAEIHSENYLCRVVA